MAGIEKACPACQVAYFDAEIPETDHALQNSRPASASSHRYKRIFVPGGNTTPSFTSSLVQRPNGDEKATPYYTYNYAPMAGPYKCSIVDYYKNGQRAMYMQFAVSTRPGCQKDGRPYFAFNGDAIYYYPSGQIREKAFYKIGKLQGAVVDYNEDGSVRNTDYYEDGKLIDQRSFAASPQDPLLGTWRRDPVATPPKELEWTFSANGIVESRFFDEQLTLVGGVIRTNWKYIPEGSAGGVLEEYQGGQPYCKGTIRWINRNRFVYTLTYDSNPDNRSLIGKYWTFTHSRR